MKISKFTFRVRSSFFKSGSENDNRQRKIVQRRIFKKMKMCRWKIFVIYVEYNYFDINQVIERENTFFETKRKKIFLLIAAQSLENDFFYK